MASSDNTLSVMLIKRLLFQAMVSKKFGMFGASLELCKRREIGGRGKFVWSFGQEAQVSQQFNLNFQISGLLTNEVGST